MTVGKEILSTERVIEIIKEKLKKEYPDKPRGKPDLQQVNTDLLAIKKMAKSYFQSMNIPFPVNWSINPCNEIPLQMPEKPCTWCGDKHQEFKLRGCMFCPSIELCDKCISLVDLQLTAYDRKFAACPTCALYIEKGTCPECKHAIKNHARNSKTLYLDPTNGMTIAYRDYATNCSHEAPLFTSIEKCNCDCLLRASNAIG